MARANYYGGREFEWAVRDALEEDGYAVSRTAGSKTKIDLYAMKPGQLLLVQCKKNGKCPPAERARLLELASWNMEAIPVVAYRPDPRRTAIAYRRLVGPGPKQWLPFSTDFSTDVDAEAG